MVCPSPLRFDAKGKLFLVDEDIKSRLPALIIIGGGLLFMCPALSSEQPTLKEYQLASMGLIAACFMGAFFFGRTRYTFDALRGELIVEKRLFVPLSRKVHPLKMFQKILIERERMISENTQKEMYSYFHVKLKGSSRKKDIRFFVPKEECRARDVAHYLSNYLQIPFEEVEQTED